VKFPSRAPVTKRKLEALKARISRLGVDMAAVEEEFLKGGGPGGQKVNKTASAVRLRYPPLGIAVKWSRERSRALNRFLALRELADEIEERVSPATSERLKERERTRRRKERRRRRGRRRAKSCPS
jgi:protein subunit release factor B